MPAPIMPPNAFVQSRRAHQTESHVRWDHIKGAYSLQHWLPLGLQDKGRWDICLPTSAIRTGQDIWLNTMCPDIPAVNSECQDTAAGKWGGDPGSGSEYCSDPPVCPLIVFQLNVATLSPKVTLTDADVFAGVQREVLAENSAWSGVQKSVKKCRSRQILWKV